MVSYYNYARSLWGGSPFVFQKLTDVFVSKLRDLEPTATTGKSKSEKK
jgi:hypothetical protein